MVSAVWSHALARVRDALALLTRTRLAVLALRGCPIEFSLPGLPRRNWGPFRPHRRTPAGYHKPGLDEYGPFYRGDRAYPRFSAWYSGFLTDETGRVFMLRVSFFPPHSRYYPGGEVELVPLSGDSACSSGDTPAYRLSWDFEAGQSEQTSEVSALRAGGQASFEMKVTRAAHTLAVDGPEFALELDLRGMEPVFFFNRGHPVPMPGSPNFLMGFEEFLDGAGTLRLPEGQCRVRASLVGERTFFDGDKWGWFEQDWITLQSDELELFLFRVRFRDRRLPPGVRSGTYAEGFVHLRQEKRVLALLGLEIEHTHYDQGPPDPVHGRIPLGLTARTTYGGLELDLRFRLVGRRGMELALLCDGSVRVGDRAFELRSALTWDEFMRHEPTGSA